MCPKSCSKHPEMSPEPMPPAGLHPPHPTSRPGPATGYGKVNRHEQPCLRGQPSSAWQHLSPRHFWELLGTPSSTQSTSQPSPACTQDLRANWALAFPSGEGYELRQEKPG